MVGVKRVFKNMVSVIVPIRHGEDITELLKSINSSYYRNYEIIVVDEGLERSEQRNIGILKAKGEYLLILDSDQHISKTLLMECVYSMKLVDALYIPEIIVTKGWFGRLRNWERQFYTSTPIDCVRFVRAKDCPFFDLDLTGPEDADWDRRVRGTKGTTHAPIYHHDNIGVLDYFKKKAYYSKSMARYAQKNKNDKVLSFWWRCFGVFLEKGKWRRFLSRPDLAFQVLVMIFIRGIIYKLYKNGKDAGD